MMENPYEPGTDEYLDWVTAQHDAAIAPKKKSTKKGTKKNMKKESKKVKQEPSIGLAGSQYKERQGRFSGGLKQMLFGEKDKR